MTTLILVLAFFSTPGQDGPALIPIHYGLSIVELSEHHGGDPIEIAGLMAAENRSRRYDPTTVGRYGAGGESGLMQLVDAWKMEALERCNARLRRGHHRYSGAGDCLSIGPRDGWEDVSMFNARQNIEAAVIAVLYMKSEETLARKPWLRHWALQYRCDPAAYGPRHLWPNCEASTRRATDWIWAVGEQVRQITAAVEVTTSTVQRVPRVVHAVWGGEVLTAEAE